MKKLSSETIVFDPLRAFAFACPFCQRYCIAGRFTSSGTSQGRHSAEDQSTMYGICHGEPHCLRFLTLDPVEFLQQCQNALMQDIPGE